MQCNHLTLLMLLLFCNLKQRVVNLNVFLFSGNKGKLASVSWVPYAFDVIFCNFKQIYKWSTWTFFCPRSRTLKRRFWKNFILSDERILTWPTEERQFWQCGKLEKMGDTHKEGSQRRIEHSSEDVTNRNRIGTRIGYQKILEISSA